MKCNGIGCRSDYPEPDIIDGTAYFVCSSCGDFHEVENYRVYSTEERIKMFEDEYGVRLPPEYTQYAGTNGSRVVKLPSCYNDSTQYYFGEGFYTIGEFSGIEPNPYGSSIFDSASLIEEWGLPKKLLLIEGDGHTWLALDYRESSTAPKVIVIESDEGNSLLVANNFKEFVESLLPYESVYDTNGNVIFNG
ncbi:SMI1/KNR4 family protein [Iodobacter sp. HSC-16F04]|uniref:SMI1/KNR4 family protein n=1 Tax=Iodobacter violaceini TaxID=3044271 RepID=A0ABX0KN01_9NEIS|nr:SMI1/KNR4 family protein [Iodobacter violacea]NHQ85570.1 SMI1/KNR4 family protein [Iodobacter violacea]